MSVRQHARRTTSHRVTPRLLRASCAAFPPPPPPPAPPPSLLLRRHFGSCAACSSPFRRFLTLSTALSAAAAAAAAQHRPATAAEASGRPSLAEVTRPAAPPRVLPPAEAAVADAFTRTTLSVANVVDITVAAAGGGVRAGGDALSTVEGNGSGVVWDADGTVVTNWHVLGGVLGRAGGRTRVASAARITLLDAAGAQHTFVADCIGADRGKDLAVLRVSAPREFVVPISRGSRVRVGQTVLAIGNPFGYDHVLTTGVVSGLERSVASAPGSLVTGAIQTDAAINPGNSGGPLLDSSGNLVGLNTAIFSPNGSTGVGVGFAIPVSTLERAVPQLIEFGRIIRPTLGISLAPEGIASQLRVKGGALVQAAVPGGPGERAGLLPTRRGLGGIVTGDVIVGIDDDPVRSAAEFNELVERRAPGDSVTLHVVRGVGGDAPEQLLDLQATLEAEA